ncbi:MAG: dienelactone hydrolase family protein [Candidatus Acidiferrales bacterium]
MFMKVALRLLAAIILVGGISAALIARAGAGAPKTETVEFKSGNDTIGGFLALPDTPGPHGAIIVIHEWWGLNDWVKEQTVKFAELGFVALAVDLYRGKTAGDPGQAHELMRGLPQDRGVQDLKAAFAYLAARKDVKPDLIGSVGWCMGGGFSIQLAVHEPHLRACVVNYGALPTDPNDIQQIGAPVMGNFGEDDRGITVADVEAFKKAMSATSHTFDVKVYPGAGHAFENPNNKDGYRPEAAAEAWTREVNFFKYLLK